MSSNTGILSHLTGYCHQCDRQVEINRDSFSCQECNGGFIELFDSDSSIRQNETNNPNNVTGDRVRVESIRLNTDNFSDFLPLLLPQLLGQRNSEHANQNQQDQQQQPQSIGNLLGNTNINMRQGPTRLQLIVPNRFAESGQEQFDLYGIINNVISEILDPRRHGAAAGQFHFQASPIRMFQLHGDLRDYAWGTNGLDTIITQLLNQLENTGPPPASEDQLKNIPQIVITQEEVDKNAQCAICMEDFNLNENAKKLPCKHLFHEPCVVEWLKLHGTCPVCRKNLNGEDTSQREYISRPPGSNTNDSNQNGSVPSTSNSDLNFNDQNNSSNISMGRTSNSRNTNSSSEPSDNSNNLYYEPDFD